MLLPHDVTNGDCAPILAIHAASSNRRPLLLRYLEHDLRDSRVRLNGGAMVQDTADMFFSGFNPWQELTCPRRLLHARWGIEHSPPGYLPSTVWEAQQCGYRTRLIAGVDHTGTVMTREGAQLVAEELRASVG